MNCLNAAKLNVNERSSTMNNAQALPSADAHNSSLDSDSTNRAPEAQAAQNALDHGIFSSHPVIEGRETLDNWLAHRETVVRELCPVGALETAYAERSAGYLWRLNRVIRYEITASLGQIEDRSTPHHEDSPAVPEFHALPASPMIQTIIKYEGHLQRCLAGTMAELRRLQKERRQGLRDVNSGGRGADRAGVCQNDLNDKGSHGGSPSQQITGPEMLIPGGRGADRAGVCQKEFDDKGSHGGSPSRNSSPIETKATIQKCSPIQKSTASTTPG